MDADTHNQTFEDRDRRTSPAESREEEAATSPPGSEVAPVDSENEEAAPQGAGSSVLDRPLLTDRRELYPEERKLYERIGRPKHHAAYEYGLRSLGSDPEYGKDRKASSGPRDPSPPEAYVERAPTKLLVLHYGVLAMQRPLDRTDLSVKERKQRFGQALRDMIWNPVLAPEDRIILFLELAKLVADELKRDPNYLESAAEKRARIASEIRQRAADGDSWRTLAREYGVSQRTISEVLSSD